MKDFFQIQKILVPEILQEMELRYDILKEIELCEVIGRRSLAQKLDLSERVVRAEVDFLKEAKLIEVFSHGMSLSSTGEELLEATEPYISKIRGLHHLEKKLQAYLGIKKVLISLTFPDENLNLTELGRTAARHIVQSLKQCRILGITGGSTMYHVAQAMKVQSRPSEVMVVSARGSLRSNYETQASNVVAIVAEKLKSNYELLQLPDNIDREIADELLKETSLEKTLQVIDNIDCLVFGIGNADDMAKRRNLSQEQCDLLGERKAVAESFGFYFNLSGEIVYESSTLGIKLSKYKQMSNIIGVAAGERKVEAIRAISGINPSLTLVTDSDTANRILETGKK
ncbi:sugar-binding transcriptional regulator [Filifactor villosus]|uniref:Sugar-binding transcriptional regulator n=1 Tax=Filifactor villosus TaxID=29374 RepID=A0ABV9QNA0_9FIRM